MKKRSKKIIFYILIIVLAFFAYKYIVRNNFTTAEREALVKEAAKLEDQKILNSLSTVLVLPNEKPEIFDIKDTISTAKNNLFFQGSIFGDKLIVFKESKKVIIWRDNTKTIVNMGPLTEDN